MRNKASVLYLSMSIPMTIMDAYQWKSLKVDWKQNCIGKEDVDPWYGLARFIALTSLVIVSIMKCVCGKSKFPLIWIISKQTVITKGIISLSMILPIASVKYINWVNASSYISIICTSLISQYIWMNYENLHNILVKVVVFIQVLYLIVVMGLVSRLCESESTEQLVRSLLSSIMVSVITTSCNNMIIMSNNPGLNIFDPLYTITDIPNSNYIELSDGGRESQ